MSQPPPCFLKYWLYYLFCTACTTFDSFPIITEFGSLCVIDFTRNGQKCSSIKTEVHYGNTISALHSCHIKEVYLKPTSELSEEESFLVTPHPQASMAPIILIRTN